MALCNLATMEAPRKRIIKEDGLHRIEYYMYEDHEMLKRAAVQAINNLMFDEEIVKKFEAKNDRTKYLVLLSGMADLEMARAAAGCLAILTAISKRGSKRIFDTTQWKEVICYLLCSPDQDLRLRGSSIVRHVVGHSKELAEKILEPEVLEVMDVVMKLGTTYHMSQSSFLVSITLSDKEIEVDFRLRVGHRALILQRARSKPLCLV